MFFPPEPDFFSQKRKSAFFLDMKNLVLSKLEKQCLLENCSADFFCVSSFRSIHYYIYTEEFRDTKGVIRIRISKDRQHNDQRKCTQGQTTSTKHTHKTKDRVTLHEPH